MPPKYGSERVVLLPERLVAMLSDHVARWCPGDDPCDVVTVQRALSHGSATTRLNTYPPVALRRAPDGGPLPAV